MRQHSPSRVADIVEGELLHSTSSAFIASVTESVRDRMRLYRQLGTCTRMHGREAGEGRPGAGVCDGWGVDFAEMR